MRELSLHILDVVQNSIEAGASLVEIKVEEDYREDLFIIEIADNGKGMDSKKLKNVTDPFVTSRLTREVGLGLPLLEEAARRCGGRLMLESTPGEGTRVKAVFQHDHLDRAPLGDITATLISLLATNEELDLVYRHLVNEAEFIFDSRKIREELGDVGLNDHQVLGWIKEYIKEGIDDL